MDAVHHFWIKCLLARGMRINEIEHLAVLKHLPLCSSDSIKKIKDAMERGKPALVTVSSADSLSWLRRQKIYSMFANDTSVRQAEEKILDDPNVRKIVEGLSLTGIAAEQVASHIATMVGVVLSPDAIRAFEHYYWNWRAIGPENINRLCHEHPYGYTYRVAYTLKEPEMVLWKLGHRTEVTRDQALRLMQNESLMRFRETGMMHNGQPAALAARLWSEIYLAADEKLNGAADDKVAELLVQLRKLQLKQVDVVIPSIDSLKE